MHKYLCYKLQVSCLSKPALGDVNEISNFLLTLLIRKRQAQCFNRMGKTFGSWSTTSSYLNRDKTWSNWSNNLTVTLGSQPIEPYSLVFETSIKEVPKILSKKLILVKQRFPLLVDFLTDSFFTWGANVVSFFLI